MMNGPGVTPRRRGQTPHPTWARGILGGGVIALALYLLSLQFEDVDPNAIVGRLAFFSPKVLGQCALLTGVSFLALGAYDMLAVRMISGKTVSLGRAWLAGSVSNAISNTIGFHAITGAAVRYRLLARVGLSGTEVAEVTAFSWTTLAFGFATMFSMAAAISVLAGPLQRVCGVGAFGLILMSTRFLGKGRKIRVGPYSLRLPSGNVALAQMGLGAIEMASAVGALFVLMPSHAGISFPSFSTIYIGAVLLGIASHAPGGIGVFETAMLTLAHQQDISGVIAALLAYRLIYNIAPFLLASLVLAGDELRASLVRRRIAPGQPRLPPV